MNLTDLANARSGFSQEMNNLLTLVAGSHTPEQRSTQINTTTAECFTLCKTAKAVRVANPSSIATKDFYSRPDLPLCSLMDGYHTNLGGTHMYEMFCSAALNPDCVGYTPMTATGNVNRSDTCTGITPPTFPSGPLVMTFVAGSNRKVYLYGFKGTMEFQDGTIVDYPRYTNISTMDIPDDHGDGFGTIMLRGELTSANHYSSVDEEGVPGFGLSYFAKDLVDVWQWGTECVIKSYSCMFMSITHPCVGISATDSPLFGETIYGTYGIDLEDMFNRNTHFNSDIRHWNTSQVKSMKGMFYSAPRFGQDLSVWPVCNVTKNSSFHNDSNPDLVSPIWA